MKKTCYNCCHMDYERCFWREATIIDVDEVCSDWEPNEFAEIEMLREENKELKQIICELIDEYNCGGYLVDSCKSCEWYERFCKDRNKGR